MPFFTIQKMAFTNFFNFIQISKSKLQNKLKKVLFDLGQIFSFYW